MKKLRNIITAIILALGITTAGFSAVPAVATPASNHVSYNDPYIIDYSCSVIYIGPYNYSWRAYGLVGFTGQWVLKKYGTGSSYSDALSRCQLWVAFYG